MPSGPAGQQLLQLARRGPRRGGAAAGGVGVGQAALDRLRGGRGVQGHLHPPGPRGGGPRPRRPHWRSSRVGARLDGADGEGRGRPPRPPMAARRARVGGRSPKAGTRGRCPVTEDGAPFVVLGVSAGIAAYKAVEVCRRLVDAGVHVAPVLTERATRFVGRATFDALGSEPAQTQPVGRGVAHPPHPPRAAGRPDRGGSGHRRPPGPLRRRGSRTTCSPPPCWPPRAPVVVCPAMHTEMWEHPAVQAQPGRPPRPGRAVVPPEDGAWPAGTPARAGWPSRP